MQPELRLVHVHVQLVGLFGEPDKPNVGLLRVSPDGRSCAVLYLRARGHMAVAVYALATQQVVAHWDTKGWDMSWSPCSTRLRLHLESKERSSLEIWEAATGRDVTPTWSPPAAAALAQKGHCAWSPDGSMLLYSVQEADMAQDLHLVHLVEGTLLTSVKLKRHACSLSTCPAAIETAEFSFMQPHSKGHALWHPSSDGLVLPGCSWTIADPQPLHRLGLKAGYCPAPAHLSLETSSFSPCGNFLLVDRTSARGQSQASSAHGTTCQRQQVSVMRRTPGRQDYEFDTQYTWGPRQPPLRCKWCPMSPALLQRRALRSEAEIEAGAAVLVSNEDHVYPAATNGVYLGDGTPPGFTMGPVMTMSPFGEPVMTSSPSGEFCTIQCTISGEAGTRIWHTPSGVCYNKLPISQDLFLPASGDCIVQWNEPQDGDGGKTKGCSFTVLRFEAPKP